MARAFIAANGSIALGDQSTHVTLPYRGTLLVCAYTTVKLTADLERTRGEVPGADAGPGARRRGDELRGWPGAYAQRRFLLLTPDFHILIGGPGAADVKVRLGPRGHLRDNALARRRRALCAGFERVRRGRLPRAAGPARHVSARQPARKWWIRKRNRADAACRSQATSFRWHRAKDSRPCPNRLLPRPARIQLRRCRFERWSTRRRRHAPQAAAGAGDDRSAGTEAGGAGNTPKAGAQKKPGFLTRVGRFFKRIFGRSNVSVYEHSNFEQFLPVLADWAPFGSDSH